MPQLFVGEQRGAKMFQLNNSIRSHKWQMEDMHRTGEETNQTSELMKQQDDKLIHGGNKLS